MLTENGHSSASSEEGSDVEEQPADYDVSSKVKYLKISSSDKIQIGNTINIGVSNEVEAFKIIKSLEEKNLNFKVSETAQKDKAAEIPGTLSSTTDETETVKSTVFTDVNENIGPSEEEGAEETLLSLDSILSSQSRSIGSSTDGLVRRSFGCDLDQRDDGNNLETDSKVNDLPNKAASSSGDKASTVESESIKQPYVLLSPQLFMSWLNTHLKSQNQDTNSGSGPLPIHPAQIINSHRLSRTLQSWNDQLSGTYDTLLKSVYPRRAPEGFGILTNLQFNIIVTWNIVAVLILFSMFIDFEFMVMALFVMVIVLLLKMYQKVQRPAATN